MRLFTILLAVLVIIPAYAEIQWSGDFRYRTEMVEDEDGVGSPPETLRTRNRLRARVKLKADVNEDAKVIVRVTSGSGSATSTNQTLETQARNKTFELDQAFVNYGVAKNTQLMAGKMKNPLARPGGSNIQFDSDLTPEGVALQWECDCENAKTFVTLGHFWVDELVDNSVVGNPNSDNEDVFHYGAQAQHIRPLGENSELTVGLGYNFYNTENSNFVTSFGGNANNGSSYLIDYAISQAFLIYTVGPILAYVDYAMNAEANAEDTAYSVGIKYGKLKEKGDYTAGLIYQGVEADSVLSLFNDSDFNGGATNAEGYILLLGARLADNSDLRFQYSNSEEILGTATDYTYAQLDFVFNF